MKFLKTKVTGINIAYIGGGSRGWAWGLMSDLASEGALCGTVRLYDIDTQAAKNNEIIGNNYTFAQGAKSKWKYKAVDSLEEALSDANFVVISILPGTFDEMEIDVHTPEKYGIYQSVGDTVGPGGINRALRAIPMFIEIAKAIKAYAPKAWVINYTNPMTVCTRTLYEVFPDIKAFGCCHEVFGAQEALAKLISITKNIKEPKRTDIKVNVKGINHFTWLDKAEYNGEDLLPLFLEFAEMLHKTGFVVKHKAENSFKSAFRVCFDLSLRYGMIAAAGDRHLAEFCPPWYLHSPEQVEKWGFHLTSVAQRKKRLQQRLDKQKELLLMDGKNYILRRTGEDGVKQMKALLGLEDLFTNVNIPNKGQISSLPLGAVVETNAYFTHNSVIPQIAGAIPCEVNSLIYRHVVNQETTLKAVIKKNKQLALCAFANDPLVTTNIDDTRELFEEMLEKTKHYLNWLP